MTTMTPELVAVESDNLLQSVITSIHDLRQELEGLKQRARSGEGLSVTNDSKTVASAASLLEMCQKVENRLAECRSKSAGIAKGGYALDLDEARAAIGSKLDRLRFARGAGDLSE